MKLIKQNSIWKSLSDSMLIPKTSLQNPMLSMLKTLELLESTSDE